MILDGDTIQFESRNDVEQLREALAVCMDQSQEPPKVIQELYNMVDAMWLSW